MTLARPPVADAPERLPHLPAWITRGQGWAPQDQGFAAGAALAHLQLVLARDTVPVELLRQRLALRAAETSVTLTGRPERVAEMRDAVHFLRPGDRPGPAGDVLLAWLRAVDHPISGKALHRALPDHAPTQLATWIAAGSGAPSNRAAAVLETLETDLPGAGTEALILADAALSRAVGWRHMLPLLGTTLTARDLRKSAEVLQSGCQRALIAAVTEALLLADDLTRRAARLRAVAPKLRGRGADQAVALFLSRDALAPTALTGFMSGRAARRICDRLVDLAAVRELTGRDTFRLYGV